MWIQEIAVEMIWLFKAINFIKLSKDVLHKMKDHLTNLMSDHEFFDK